MSEILLPRRDSDGRCYISYSQWNAWKSDKSFSLGVDGKIEYMVQYFFGHRYPDQGWAQFGSDVEDYICLRQKAETFNAKERKTLDKIEPLGVFQTEVKWEFFPGVYLLGYIDDATEGFTKIRDYKTASNSSKSQYYEDKYKQLDIYAAWVHQEFGFLPELEVKIIERKGNCFGMVERRDLLSVGEHIWTVPRETSFKRIEAVQAELITTVFEISDAYKMFLKLNGI